MRDLLPFGLLVRFSSLPVRMKKIQSKFKELEWSLILFFRCSKTANSIVDGKMWPKLKLIQAFMVVLVPARMMKINFKMKTLE